MVGNGEIQIVDEKVRADSLSCACGEEFRRAVAFIPTGYTDRITKCMACGAVDHIQSFGYEPQPGDIRHAADIPMVLDSTLRDWFRQWPPVFHIVANYRCHTGYFPVTQRFPTVDEMRRWEESESPRQLTLSESIRLRQAGYPESAPPVRLDGELGAFQVLWDAVQLTPDHDFDDLVGRAGRGSLSAPFAIEMALLNAGCVNRLAPLFGDSNEDRRRGAYIVVREGCLQDPRLLAAMLAQLETTPLAPAEYDGYQIAARWQVGEFLETLRVLRPDPSTVRDDLERLRKRILKKDPLLYRRIGETMAELAHPVDA